MKKLKQMQAAHGGQLPCHTGIGLYPIIYWIRDDVWQDILPLCGDCMTRYMAGEYGDEWTFLGLECGADYDHNLPCEKCGYQLSAYYEDEDGRE